MNAVRSSNRKLTNNDRRSLEKYPETYMEYSYLEILTEDKCVKLCSREDERKTANKNKSNSGWFDN